MQDLSYLIPTGLEGIFFVLLFVFSLHALFLGYHWFTFGTSRHVSSIALALYLGGGAILFLTLSISLNLV